MEHYITHIYIEIAFIFHKRKNSYNLFIFTQKEQNPSKNNNHLKKKQMTKI